MIFDNFIHPCAMCLPMVFVGWEQLFHFNNSLNVPLLGIFWLTHSPLSHATFSLGDLNLNHSIILRAQSQLSFTYYIQGSFINHVVNFLSIFDLLPPFVVAFTNKSYICYKMVRYMANPLTLNCPRGLQMTPQYEMQYARIK